MIQFEHLSVAYQQTLALEDLSLTIQGPTILGILGPNGAGKSTLIKAMLGLLPHAGKVQLDQKDLSQVLQRVAYVEQKSAIDFHFPITVRECISLGLYPHLSIFKEKILCQIIRIRCVITKCRCILFIRKLMMSIQLN